MTEVRRVEAERAQLAAAIEQSAESISMHGLDGIVTYVNPAFTRTYGYEPAEIIGRHGGMIDSGRHDPAFFVAIRATAAAGRTWTGTIVNRRKDGTPIEVEAVISAIQDADGRVASYVQADRDVTRERELERALERDAREREAIETALARIDPAGSAEEIAAAACAVINGLPGVDSTWAAALDEVDGAVLAATGDLAPTFARGRPIPPSRVDYLCERGSGGAWFEEWRPRAGDGAWSEAVTSTGLRAMAYAPLRSPRGVVGVVGIGSHDPLTSQSLVEHVAALATFASILGAQLVPKLEGRRRDADARSTPSDPAPGLTARRFPRPPRSWREPAKKSAPAHRTRRSTGLCPTVRCLIDPIGNLHGSSLTRRTLHMGRLGPSGGDVRWVRA